MLCATLKQGVDCAFMTKKGCEFNGGSCKIVLAQCEGCERVAVFPTGKYCLSFPDPTVKWRRGPCNMASHIKAETKNHQEAKVRVGQQKQKKK